MARDFGHRLVEAAAQLDPRSRRLEADWTAGITPGQLAVFARGRGLPQLAATSTGSATLELGERRLQIDAGGRFEGRGWAELDPRLAEIGDLTADAAVAGTVTGGRLEARRLRLAVSGADGREILRASALQPVVVDLDRWRIEPERWGETALRFEADRMPLRWVRGFTPGVGIEGGALSLALDVVPVDARSASLETHAPIRAVSVVLRTNGGVELPPLDLAVEPRITLEHGALAAAVERARLTTPAGLDLRFGGRAATSRERWPVVDLDGDLSVSLPGVHRLIDEIDRVSGRVRLQLHLDSMVIAAENADLQVTEADGHSLLAVRFDNEEPLRLALPSLTPDWASSTPQRVQVVVDGFPVDWVSPFLPEIDLEGGALFGELRAVTGGGRGLSLESVAPFELRGLTPVYRGRRFAAGATASVEPRLELDDEQALFALEKLRVRTPGRGRLDGELVLVAPRDGRRRIEATLVLEGEYPPVAERIGRLGALSWRQRAVVDLPSRTLEVTDLDLGLTDAAGTRFLEATALRPFKVAAAPFAVGVDGGSPDILLATVTPLQLQQLFPRVLGFELEGVLPQGQFVGRAEGGGLLLAADDPLVFRDLTVRWGEAALLDRVTIGLGYQVLYSADGLQARSIDFETLGPRGTAIADATLRAVMPLTDNTTLSSLHFEAVANLEPLTRQPIFRELPAFLGGTVGGSLDLTTGERSTLESTVILRGATIDTLGRLPDLDASLGVARVAGEHLEITAPLRLTSEANGSSDLRFEGEVEKTGNGARFDAALMGERVAVADVMTLVRLVAPDDGRQLKANRARPPAEVGERWSTTAIAQLRERRDTRPVWGERVSGRARLDIGRLQLPRYAVHDIRGVVEVDPPRLALTTAEAELLGAELTMAGALGFDAAADQPYELRFETGFTDLNLGALFRAVDPEAPPTLEGVFEVRSEASGRGRNLADLGFGSLGSVRLSGRDGVFRGLAGQFGLARTGARVLGFLTFSKQLKAVSRLLGELEALEFDTFALEIARETPRRFAISELQVVSPLAVIDGGGGIEVEPGVPLVASPLDASFDMATRGDLTILFDGLGLLGEGEDERGCRPLTRPVTVGGTVSEPDTSAFYEMLDEASRDSKGVVGVAMRKVNKKLQRGR